MGDRWGQVKTVSVGVVDDFYSNGDDYNDKGK